MTIANIACDHYRIPLPTTLSDSTHGDMSDFELIVVRITDDQGGVGLGYTYTVGTGARAIHSLIADDLVPALKGADETAIEALWKKMWWRLHFIGRGGAAAFAIAAVDIALWDLKARRADMPLWRLLGGHDAQVRAYAGGIDLQFPIERLLEQTRGNLDKGFRAIKMKIGRDRLSEDVSRIAAMRDMLGDEFPLMVDANMRWSADQAVRAARAFEDFDLVWLEEPIEPEDIAGHVRLRQLTAIPIATGENFHSLADFRAMIEAGGVSFPEPDVATCGGVTVWMKVATLAESHNLPVTSHGVHDLHVHLLAAVPNASYLEVHGFGLEDFIAEPLRITDGFATAPDRPGHGVAFDFEGLEKLRV
jgi:L-alanine-DL-glutamate epimerase-like enolase superfamily enzyme